MAIRVLHLVHWLNRGGIECWVTDFIRYADRNVVQMDICCKGPHTGVLAGSMADSGAVVHHLPLGWNHTVYSRRLSRLLREGKYDVLHIHAGAFVSCPTHAAARVGVPVVTTFHSTSFSAEQNKPDTSEWQLLATAKATVRNLYVRRSLREGCAKSSAVVMCSEAVGQSVQSVVGRLPQQSTSVIPCGTNKRPGRNLADRESVRSEFGLDDSVPLAIHVGTFREAKNHPALLRIMVAARQRLPGIRLLVAGDGPLRPAVERMVCELDLGDSVRLLGSRNDVERLLSAADLMIFPSLWEGLPVAVVEAHMKGLPVVGSNIGPMVEATRDGETSRLFDVSDEKGMADAVVELMPDRSRLQCMSQAAVRFAESRFTMAATSAAYLDIYRRCAASLARN